MKIVTVINVDVVMLSRQLITSRPPHSSHIKAVSRLHARCLAPSPGRFCNIVCLLLQISVKAERQTGAVITVGFQQFISR